MTTSGRVAPVYPKTVHTGGCPTATRRSEISFTSDSCRPAPFGSGLFHCEVLQLLFQLDQQAAVFDLDLLDAVGKRLPEAGARTELLDEIHVLQIA